MACHTKDVWRRSSQRPAMNEPSPSASPGLAAQVCLQGVSAHRTPVISGR